VGAADGAGLAARRKGGPAVLTVLAIVVVFGLLVSLHELGHFVVGKLAGIRVEEYAIGFGPALFQVQGPETLYALRAIPLGGYCRFAGMEPDEPVERLDGRGFNQRPVWQRSLVILAGPAMNLLLAAVLYIVVFGPVGIPSPTTVVARALPGYPAYTAGIRPGDRIVAVDHRRVHTWTELQTTIVAHSERPLTVTVAHGRHVKTVVLRARYDPAAHERIIGIEPVMQPVHLPIFGAIGAGVVQTVQLTGLWLQQLGRLLTGRGLANLTGPVGIAVMVGQAVQQGWVSLLLLAAALSANLGLFNLLPIPVLDGSKLLFMGMEAVRRRPLDAAKENLINMVGFMVLLAFVLFVTYHDLLRLVGGVSG
jgi:regulator of sigma E protease